MTLAEIAISQVSTLTKVVAAAGDVEEDLNAEDKVEGGCVVVGEGDMDSCPRTRLTLEPKSPSPITP